MQTPPGYPASFASFAFRLDCPLYSPPPQSSEMRRCIPVPHGSSLPFRTNRAVIWPFHHMGGKNNPPPSVISIVHQHQQEKLQKPNELPNLKCCKRINVPISTVNSFPVSDGLRTSS